MAARRDHRLAAFIENDVMEAVSVIGPVGEDLACGQPSHQIAGRRHVVLLAWTDLEADRQAKGIYDDMELCTEATPGTTESLGLRSPLFRRAPAA